MMINDLPDEDDDAEKPEDENAETPDRSVEEVQALARSLGFALMPQDGGDDDEGVGYFVLISTAGDHPLGPDAVSITDIVRLLTEYAADLGEEVDDEIDINEHLKKQKPPPGAKKKAAAILKADKPRLDEVAIDDPLMAERIRDHNAQVMQDRWLKRTNQSTALHDPESEQDTFYREYDPADSVPLTGAFLSPEDGEYDPAPKAVAGFAVTSNTRRMSRAEMAKRRSLLNYKAELQAALGERQRDQVKIGKILYQAKALIGHGGFEKWVTQELRLPARTAQSYIASARSRNFNVKAQSPKNLVS
jgi:hypothetical protein